MRLDEGEEVFGLVQDGVGADDVVRVLPQAGHLSRAEDKEKRVLFSSLKPNFFANRFNLLHNVI